MACLPQPISIPIGNVSFPNGGVMRGVQLGVGSPVQNFAFMPQWSNNSYLYDAQSHCPNGSTFALCMTARGGIYDPSRSTTSHTQVNVETAGGASGDVDHNPADVDYNTTYDTALSDWVTDDFVLATDLTMPSFPVGLERIVRGNIDNYSPQAALGLGTNSTVLNILKSTGRIASRVWSLFWGLNGAEFSEQADGVFVLGGYDSGKIIGTNYTKALAMNSECHTGMLVGISDMRVKFPNGTMNSIFGTDKAKALNACIDPSFPYLMTLPYINYGNLENLLCPCHYINRSLGVNYFTMLFRTGLLADADFVIEIDNQIDITVRSSQLHRPQLEIDDTGRLTANYSVDNLLVYSNQATESEDLLTLGYILLTGAMLMVNQDQNTFTLWQAGATSAAQSLVAVDGSGRSVEKSCTESSTNGTAIAASTGPASSPLSTGAIVGIAAGAGAGVLVLLAGAFLLRRHTSQAGAQQPVQSSLSEEKRAEYSSGADYASDLKPTTPPAYDAGPYEVYASPRVPAELSSSHDRRYEME